MNPTRPIYNVVEDTRERKIVERLHHPWWTLFLLPLGYTKYVKRGMHNWKDARTGKVPEQRYDGEGVMNYIERALEVRHIQNDLKEKPPEGARPKGSPTRLKDESLKIELKKERDLRVLAGEAFEELTKERDRWKARHGGAVDSCAELLAEREDQAREIDSLTRANKTHRETIKRGAQTKREQHDRIQELEKKLRESESERRRAEKRDYIKWRDDNVEALYHTYNREAIEGMVKDRQRLREELAQARLTMSQERAAKESWRESYHNERRLAERRAEKIEELEKSDDGDLEAERYRRQCAESCLKRLGYPKGALQLVGPVLGGHKEWHYMGGTGAVHPYPEDIS